jgi:hypothetical protein
MACGARQAMDFLELTYSGKELSDGSTKARNHRGGCIKGVLVKKKGMMVSVVNDAFEKFFMERFYKRDILSPELEKLKKKGLVPQNATWVSFDAFDELVASPPGGINPDDWTDSMTKQVKKMFYKAACAKYLVKCKVDTHGCEGLIYYSAYHPGRKRIDDPSGEVLARAPSTPISEKKSEKELLRLLSSSLKSGKVSSRDFFTFLKSQNEGKMGQEGYELDQLSQSTSRELFPSGKRIKVISNGSQVPPKEIPGAPTGSVSDLPSSPDGDNESEENTGVYEGGLTDEEDASSPITVEEAADEFEDRMAVSFLCM